jgi:hypothetical protein
MLRPSLDISALSVLDFTPDQGELYLSVLLAPDTRLDALAEQRGASAGRLREELSPLVAAGLVELRGELVVAAPPEVPLSARIAEEARQLAGRETRLSQLRNLVPVLTAEHLMAGSPAGEPVEVERVADAESKVLVRQLSASTTGDLMWLRPNPWETGTGDLDTWVADVVRRGRRSRAIYPARALEEAPSVLRQRAEAGEHVRVLADVPLRLAVMGSAAAVIAEDFGIHDGPKLVLRQSSMIGALTWFFDNLWERAMPVPGLGGTSGGERLSARRLLLDQLMAGAKDEQIARTLGLSLRTVRRRVAEVLEELEAVSRFQAGAEAVRRGWL